MQFKRFFDIQLAKDLLDLLDYELNIRNCIWKRPINVRARAAIGFVELESKSFTNTSAFSFEIGITSSSHIKGRIGVLLKF